MGSEMCIRDSLKTGPFEKDLEDGLDKPPEPEVDPSEERLGNDLGKHPEKMKSIIKINLEIKQFK